MTPQDDVLLNKRTESEQKKNESKSKILFQAIAFYLEDNIFAIDIMDIRDIIIPRKTYQVPNTNEKLLGVLNLRGEILPVYSLKLIMEMEDPLRGKRVVEIDEDEDKFIITVQKDKDIFGILLDGIYKNINATDDNFRREKYLKKWSNNYLFDGVILEEEKEILVIKTENMLNYMVSLK